MLERIVSGGQSGADQAGWRAAKAQGIATGGRMPAGFLTEAGPRPDFAEMYGAVEMPGGGSPERTRANARDSDATNWFGDPESPGGRTTLRACAGFGKPVYLVIEGLTQPAEVAAWIEAEEVRVLNVAGNRESTEPGIGERAERFLAALFDRLADHGAPLLDGAPGPTHFWG
jgi:Circularly permutated YpsA SLOG family